MNAVAKTMSVVYFHFRLNKYAKPKPNPKISSLPSFNGTIYLGPRAIPRIKKIA